ncbi:MAG: hypothetical protein JW892_12465 [Anaerolineae bacterium]|nr:hypothetical protein [Anaerolineae bacterium]
MNYNNRSQCHWDRLRVVLTAHRATTGDFAAIPLSRSRRPDFGVTGFRNPVASLARTARVTWASSAVTYVPCTNIHKVV